MPLRTVSPDVTFANIVRDFEAAWNGIAAAGSHGIGRGNFLFGLFGTILLEWAFRVCREDPQRESLDRLARSLYQIEPRYFTPLPPNCGTRQPRDFKLPSVPEQPPPPLLWALFDLIRNGQAHQYQQIPARLDADFYLWISIKGAEPGGVFPGVCARGTSDHLAFCVYRDGNVGVRVRADQFFWDIRSAVETSGLLGTGLKHSYFTRDYGITRSELLECLKVGKHSEFSE